MYETVKPAFVALRRLRRCIENLPWEEFIEADRDFEIAAAKLGRIWEYALDEYFDHYLD